MPHYVYGSGQSASLACRNPQNLRSLMPAVGFSTTVGLVDHARAYASLLDQLLDSLWVVETEESAKEFVTRAVRSVQNQAAMTKEFYIGEFLNIFKDAVVDRSKAAGEACRQAIDEAKVEAAVTTVELQARLATARAAGDQAAEHALWREREELQSKWQAKVDAASSRIDPIMLRLKTCEKLASALGSN
jgi:hypothetical protein